MPSRGSRVAGDMAAKGPLRSIFQMPAQKHIPKADWRKPKPFCPRLSVAFRPGGGSDIFGGEENRRTERAGEDSIQKGKGSAEHSAEPLR